VANRASRLQRQSEPGGHLGIEIGEGRQSVTALLVAVCGAVESLALYYTVTLSAIHIIWVLHGQMDLYSAGWSPN
jgi:hypothetical protein